MPDSNATSKPASGTVTPSLLTYQLPSVSSSTFNRRPLSDTPVVSRTGSPREHPVTFPISIGSGPGSGSESMRITPTSSIANVPALSIGSEILNHNGSSGTHISRSSNSLGALSPITSNDHDTISSSTPATSSPIAVTPRSHRRATTLDVPGLTRSRASPNGHISQRDIGSKLVIVMVGLPARGKSYLTNKLCRYLNWLQHDAKIFNVGNTRRKASKNPGPAITPLPDTGPHSVVWNQPPQKRLNTPEPKQHLHQTSLRGPGGYHTNDNSPSNSSPSSPVLKVSTPPIEKSENTEKTETSENHSEGEKKAATEQTADFFSPNNSESLKLREQWAMDTLDALLDYVVDGPGSIGILDATNTTIARRKKVLRRIKERTNGELRVLFVESICSDSRIIERNVRLKLSGPDYKNSDTDVALRDFVERMHNYEKVYQTLTEDEAESDSFQFVKMIDVGKKIHTFNIKGFLAPDVVAFLLNFNLAERQIWITRHGESVDNAAGRIGGDSKITARGQKFAKALTRFVTYQKSQFRKNQLKQHFENKNLLQKPKPVDSEFSDMQAEEEESPEPEEPNFCVWSSMLRRSVETAAYFDEEEYDIKEMRMLNELGAGICDGMTYPEIKATYPHEYQARISDKISYRYPGPGGESYLDVINRIRSVIVEVERMTDNLLIIAHRVVCRILLAYFMNLGRDAIGDLDVPLHTLYCLEPKPYGVGWEVYEYDDKTDWFYRVPKETLVERSRRNAPPKYSGRSRQFSVAPTEALEVPQSQSQSQALPQAPTYTQIHNILPSLATGTASGSGVSKPAASFSIGTSPILRQPATSLVSSDPAPAPNATSGSSVGINVSNTHVGAGAPGFSMQRGLNSSATASPLGPRSRSNSHNAMPIFNNTVFQSSGVGSPLGPSSRSNSHTTMSNLSTSGVENSDQGPTGPTTTSVPSSSAANANAPAATNAASSTQQSVTLPHTPYSTLPTISELSARLNDLSKF